MLNNTSRIRDRIIYFAQMEDGAGLGSVDSMRQKSLLCWRLTFVCVFTFHIAKAFCSSFILKLWYCPSVKKTNVLCLMATHQCHKKEHALMEHTVLKLFWDLDTWLTALAYWMLHYSEGNGDFEFWFTVWPDKIPILHRLAWQNPHVASPQVNGPLNSNRRCYCSQFPHLTAQLLISSGHQMLAMQMLCLRSADAGW